MMSPLTRNTICRRPEGLRPAPYRAPPRPGPFFLGWSILASVKAPFDSVDCAFLAAISALVNIAVLRPESVGGESGNDRAAIMLHLPIANWPFVCAHLFACLAPEVLFFSFEQFRQAVDAGHPFIAHWRVRSVIGRVVVAG